MYKNVQSHPTDDKQTLRLVTLILKRTNPSQFRVNEDTVLGETGLVAWE